MDWNLNNPLWIASLLFVCSLLGLWMYYLTGKKLGVLDQADKRSSHQGQIVTGAGFVLMCVLCIGAWLVGINWMLIAAIALLALVGFVDDKLDLPKSIRLLAQLMAIAVMFYVLKIHAQPLWLLAILAFLTLWWVNLFNFMDGANGMAGLHILVCCIWYFIMLQGNTAADMQWLGLMALLSGGAYVLFNFPNAALFMGDSGSLPFALILAALALTGLFSGVFSYWQVAVLHAVFISDASYTLIHRMLRKEKFWQPHNTHLYQRIIKAGQPHWRVSLGYALITGVLGLLAWWMQNRDLWLQMAVMGGIYAVLWMIFMKTQQLKR